MKKRIFAGFGALMLLASAFTTPAFALEQEIGAPIEIAQCDSAISLRWTNIADISPRISASGRTVYPEVYARAKDSSATITGTMYLEESTSSGWEIVTSWSISGVGSLSASKSYVGDFGTTYRTRVVITVGSESVEVESRDCSI